MNTVFQPLQVRNLTLPNRLVLPAMVTRLSGEDGHVNDDVRARYVRFAQGGVGMLVVEAMAVHSAKSGPLLRISSDEFVPGLTDLASRCHDAGPGRVFPQIIHFLKVARSGWRQTVDMLSPEELDGIVEAYGAAARRARACGFDGVELHMAHAYTLSSFLSRLNPRKDGYGGTLENRLRLPLRVLRRVRSEVGEDFPVGVRFVGEECIRNGYTVLEAGLIARRLAEAGADLISLSAGGKFEDARVIPGEPLYPYTGYSGDRCMPGATYPDGTNLYIPEAVRLALRNASLATPVVAVGKVGTLAMANEILASGKGDLVGMARALLADPDLPNKWQSGGEERVVRCVYGNVCKALDENFRRVDCTLWPKKLGQAPTSDDREAPTWGEFGAELRAEYTSGRVRLRWSPARDNEAVYGYQVFRSESGGPMAHLASVRAQSQRFEDARVIGGCSYAYSVKPYDLAGNRGPVSEVATVSIPEEHVAADTQPAVDSDPGSRMGCVAGES